MNFKEITLRLKTSSRGGGVEIDLTTLGFSGHKMSAYQNYLGGGMLGSIQSNDTIRSQVSNVRLQLRWSSDFDKLDDIATKLKEYFHSITNQTNDFEDVQELPSSSY